MNESNQCPNCGAYLNEGEEVCLSCGFSFASVLKCPSKSEDGICERTETHCHINDMGWEACQELREGS